MRAKKILDDLNEQHDETLDTIEFSALKNAALEFESVLKSMHGKKASIFLDYDGTLTPIVSQPEDAILSADIRSTVKKISKQYLTGIISGRDRLDVQKLVKLPNLIYAGSHGFDISGPGDMEFQHEKGIHLLPLFEKTQRILEKKLLKYPGSKVDRKLFAIAIHYRNVAPELVKEVKEIVAELIIINDGLKLGKGKMVLEIKPAFPWDKGKAMKWLLDNLDHNNETCPIFIGDDLTDESAFAELKDLGGIGILVGDHGSATSAQYSLEDVNDVHNFFKLLLGKKLVNS